MGIEKYFRERVRIRLEEYRNEIGPRLDTYLDYIDTCNSIDEIKEAAEIDLVIQYLEYIRTINNKLSMFGLSLKSAKEIKIKQDISKAILNGESTIIRDDIEFNSSGDMEYEEDDEDDGDDEEYIEGASNEEIDNIIDIDYSYFNSEEDDGVDGDLNAYIESDTDIDNSYFDCDNDTNETDESIEYSDDDGYVDSDDEDEETYESDENYFDGDFVTDENVEIEGEISEEDNDIDYFDSDVEEVEDIIDKGSDDDYDDYFESDEQSIVGNESTLTNKNNIYKTTNSLKNGIQNSKRPGVFMHEDTDRMFGNVVGITSKVDGVTHKIFKKGR